MRLGYLFTTHPLWSLLLAIPPKQLRSPKTERWTYRQNVFLMLLKYSTIINKSYAGCLKKTQDLQGCMITSLVQ